MMSALEIVKMWNAKKGTRFPFRLGNEDSAIVKKISSLLNDYENAEKYFLSFLDKPEVNDIWVISDGWKIRNWKPVNLVEVKPEENKTDVNVLSLLSEQIVTLMGKELANKINAEVENKLNDFVKEKTLIKVVEYNGEYKKTEDVTHECFETVLKYIAMKEPVMLSGPAGTGKNYIAKQVADALGLNFYFSNAVTQEYKITGYGDANGEYVKTQFFDAFTKGGVFLLDEMDASCPEALIVLNCAIANGYFDFPVIGRVEAHKDFRVIACANTYGTGASLEYVARNQLDGATLNRFAIVEVDYDKNIEDSVCPDKDIADFCRAFRNICNKNGVHHIVSYREMSRLCKMINVAELDKVVAVKTGLVKGLEKDTLRMIYNDMSESIEYKKILKKVID